MLNVAILNPFKLNVVMLNVDMLNVVMLNVVMLNVVMMIVVAPFFLSRHRFKLNLHNTCGLRCRKIFNISLEHTGRTFDYLSSDQGFKSRHIHWEREHW
jgi:hypothetical protein